MLWERYVWEGPVTDLDTYTDTNRDDSRAVFVPGIGCTVNSIMDMNNIESTHGSTYDTAGLHRSRDPGSGGFTPYHNSLTTAVTDIVPGSELFASYGDYWIPQIEGAQVTLDATLDHADDFLRNEYWPWIQEHKMTDALKQGMWELTQKDFPYKSQAYSVLPSVPWAEVEAVITESPLTTSIVRSFIRKQSIRTPEWLEKHGRCQDHIKPGKSTIEQAGRGAFANRNLPEGTIVGYSPLVHIGYYGREILEIDYDDGERQQMDLVINYSFEHRNSSVLLTPYGGMVNYINHSKERANVKLRWPLGPMVAHKPDWLEQDIPFLRDTIDKIGLSFEYIALRDIEEGEEVFMDYGDEWQAAWDEHVKNWEAPEGARDYVHTTDWPEDEPLRTLEELETKPYPPHFITMCHESYSVDKDGDYAWLQPLRTGSDRIYCDVTERSDGADTVYTVDMHLSNGETITVHDVEREGLFLYDEAFSADWHLPNAFRHSIAIPDDIMPATWMNLLNEAVE